MRRRSAMPLVGAAALVTAVLWGSPAGATQFAPTAPSLTAPAPGLALKAAITQELTSMSLPGCALTYAEHAGAQVTCLKAAPRTSTAAQQAAPAATAGICYYQNGPYGSAAMYNGWRACVTGQGDGYVPPASTTRPAPGFPAAPTACGSPTNRGPTPPGTSLRTAPATSRGAPSETTHFLPSTSTGLADPCCPFREVKALPDRPRARPLRVCTSSRRRKAVQLAQAVSN